MAAACALPSITRTVSRGCCWPAPGVKVVVPSTPLEAAGLLLSAIDDPDPVVMMEPIRLYRAAREALPDAHRAGAAGRGARAAHGRARHAGGVGRGGARRRSKRPKRCARRRHRGRSDRPAHAVAAGLGHAGRIASNKTGRLVVAHEAPRTGGPGGELVANLVERCFYALRSPPRRVAGATWSTRRSCSRTCTCRTPRGSPPRCGKSWKTDAVRVSGCPTWAKASRKPRCWPGTSSPVTR